MSAPQEFLLGQALDALKAGVGGLEVCGIYNPVGSDRQNRVGHTIVILTAPTVSVAPSPKALNEIGQQLTRTLPFGILEHSMLAPSRLVLTGAEQSRWIQNQPFMSPASLAISDALAVTAHTRKLLVDPSNPVLLELGLSRKIQVKPDSNINARTFMEFLDSIIYIHPDPRFAKHVFGLLEGLAKKTESLGFDSRIISLYTILCSSIPLRFWDSNGMLKPEELPSLDDLL